MQNNRFQYLEEWHYKLMAAVANGDKAIVEICIEAINKLFPDIQNQVNDRLSKMVDIPITKFTNHRNALYLSLTESKLKGIYPRIFSYNAVNQLFYAPGRSFCNSYYTTNGKQISREDLLKAIGYSIKVAQFFAPNNPLYEQASNTVIVCKAIDDSICGKGTVMPTAKMLHYANDFITHEVLKQARTDDEKSQTYGMSLLIDLVIDLFSN